MHGFKPFFPNRAQAQFEKNDIKFHFKNIEKQNDIKFHFKNIEKQIGSHESTAQ